MVAALAFVTLRLVVFAHGDITRFIDVGSAFANPRLIPRGVAVVKGSGYDGMFYYRLALNPSDLHRTAYGITFDSASRLQRIMYPVLAWAASFGQARLLPYSLVAVNIVALGAMAWFSALLARDSGRRAAWGLLIVGYFGFLFSLGRDLTEICEACFVVAALLAMRRNRPITAGLLLAAAALSRETAMGVVAAVALMSVIDLARRRRGPGRWDLAWVIPIVVYAGWQLIGWAEIGTLPVRADTGDNLATPFVAMTGAVGHYLRLLPSWHSVIWLTELAALVLMAAVAASTLRTSRAPAREKVAWGVSLAVVISLSKGVWDGHADFRGFEDLYVLSAVVLLGSDRRLRIVAAVVAVVWVITFVHRVVSL